jgi:hypothetical protein
VVQAPEEAEFVLAHGTEALGRGDGRDPVPTTLDNMQLLLRKCADSGRRIPMIVANPDIVTVDGGALRVMPGTLAKEYASLGGEVDP